MQNKKLKLKDKVVDKNLEKEGVVIYVDALETFATIKWSDRQQDVILWHLHWRPDEQAWFIV